MNVTLTDGRRITLPPQVEDCRTETGTGTWIYGIHIGPKSGCVIVETYSQWQRGDSGCPVGPQYHEAAREECARLADLYPSLAEKLDEIHPPERID